MPSRRRLLFLLALAPILIGWAVWQFAYDGADPRLIFWPRPPEPGEPAALGQIVSLHLEARRLRDVLAGLEDKHDLRIRVDDAVLKNAGITLNPPVSLDADRVTLRTLLYLLAGQVDDELVAAVDRGGVVFTTQTYRETIRDNYVSRVYDLDELLAGGEPFDEQALGDLVQRVVTPDNWASVGGGGQLHTLPGAIVVEQLPETQRTIASLLTGLAQLQREPARREPLYVGLPPAALPGRTRVLAALDSRGDAAFVETPLREAMMCLGDEHHVPIVLDTTALANDGISVDTPISLAPIHNASLRSVLTAILSNLDLTFVVHDDVLLVTTWDTAEERHQRVRLYPVRDLLDGKTRTADELVDVVRSCIAPDSWDWVGGPAEIDYVAGALVVLQLDEHHEQIERLLAELRHTLAPSLSPQPPNRPVDVAARRIEAALAETTSLVFFETPLTDVAREIGKRHHLNLVLDTRALDGVGIGYDSPITCSMQDMPLEHALQCTLHDLDLVFMPSGELLWITTPEEAEARLTTRCYPAQTLVAAGDGDVGALMDMLTTIVDPNYWEDVGGPGAVESFGDVLVVEQTRAVHAQTASLLAALGRYVDACDSIAPIDAPVGPQLWKKRLLAALEEPTSFDFDNTPLREVAEAIARRHHVPVRLDQRALDGAGIDEDAPVTVQLDGLRLESALRLALSELDLTTIVGESAITITTPEESEDRGQYPRVYPVRDLASAITVDNSAYFHPDPAVGYSGGMPLTSSDVLVEFVTTLVDPDVWNAVGGPAEIDCYAGAMVVTAQREVHVKVERLLADLRHAWRPADYPPPLETAKDAAASRIEQTLDEPTTIRLVNRTLGEAVEDLSHRYGIRVLLDRRALDSVGIGADTPVSLEGEAIPLEHALRPMLDDLDLTFLLRDESLLITTLEEADAELITRCYAVHRLVEGRDVDELIDTITEAVAPDEWEDVGGPGAVDYIEGVLNISQTREVHQHVAALLAAMQAHLDAPGSTAPIDAPVGPQEINRRALAALAEPADFEFQQKPLAKAAQSIAQRYGVPVRFNMRALDGVGVDGDAPVSGSAEGLPLETAFRCLLLEYELTLMVRDSAIVITTPEEHEHHGLFLRLYPAGDLLTERKSDELADFVRETIDARIWRHVSGPASISAWDDMLVVRAGRETHRRIERLLDGLRAMTQTAMIQAKPTLEPRFIFPAGDTAEQIFAALDAPADVIVDNEPLGAALQRLAAERRVPLWTEQNLPVVGVDIDRPISFALRGATFGRALELLLAEHHLRYYVLDDVLLVADSRPHDVLLAESTRLYSIADIRHRYPPVFEPAMAPAAHQSPAAEEEASSAPAFLPSPYYFRRMRDMATNCWGPFPTPAPPAKTAAREETSEPPQRLDSIDDRLVRALVQCTAAWHPASVMRRGDVVAVTGSPSVHRSVREVLAALRGALAEGPAPVPDRLLYRRVTLLCHDLPLPEAMRRLSHESGLPIWALPPESGEAPPRVSCQLEQVPLRNLLAALSTPDAPLAAYEDRGVEIVGRSKEIASREYVRIYPLDSVLNRFAELDAETLARFTALAVEAEQAPLLPTFLLQPSWIPDRREVFPSLPSLLVVRATPARHAAVASFLGFVASQADQSPRPYELCRDDNAAAVAALAARLRSARNPVEVAWLAGLVTCVDHPTDELSAALVAKLDEIDRDGDQMLTVCHALMHCGRSGAKAVPLLAAALDQTQSEERRNTLLLTLGRLGPEGAAIVVAEAARMSSNDQRRNLQMLEILRRCGPAARGAMPSVIDQLSTNRPAAVRTLKSIDPHGDAILAYIERQTTPSFANHLQGVKRSLIDVYPHWAQSAD